MPTSPLVTIGMPVYNGEEFIAEAIESLIAQSFTDWILIISDNHSTDKTEQICKHYCQKDERITYTRHAQNNGIMDNFRFVLEIAQTPYFMWTGHDDLWEPDFIEACLNGISMQEDLGFAFSNMVNVDSSGSVIRTYPSFSLFAQQNQAACITSFMLEPKYNGKANLMCSLFKLKNLKGYMLNAFDGHKTYPQSFDVAFILGILCRTRLFVDERVLFKKRSARGGLDKSSISSNYESPYATELIGGHDVGLYQDLILANVLDTEFEGLLKYLLYYRQKVNFEMQPALLLQAKNSELVFSRIFSKIRHYFIRH